MLVSFYWRVTYELRLIPVHMMQKLFAPEEGVDAPRLQPVHHVLDEDAPRTMCNIVISCSGGQVRKLLQFTKLSKIATTAKYHREFTFLSKKVRVSSSVALINIASPISLCDDEEEEEEEALLVGHGDEGGGCRWVSDPEVELFLWGINIYHYTGLFIRSWDNFC